MESLLGLAQTDLGASPNLDLTSAQIKYSLDVSIVATLTESTDDDGVGINDSYKALTISAQEIVRKINELLKSSLPEGLESLTPEETTPEATADRVVTGITSLYAIFAKQNSNLSEEEQLEKFMVEARKGVQEGYDDAFEILEGLGAFTFDGVQSGVEQTKILIEQKLDAFYKHKREELGLSAPAAESTTPDSKGSEERSGVTSLHLVA